MEHKQRGLTKYYSFVDIEGTGDHLETSRVLAIAVRTLKITYPIARTAKPEFVQGFKVALETEDALFEPDCLRKFWHRDPEMKKLKLKLQKEGIPRVDGLQQFVQHLHFLRRTYPGIMLVTDNKVYDLGRINFELAMELHAIPCVYVCRERDGFIHYEAQPDLDLSDWIQGTAYGLGLVVPGQRFSKYDMVKFLYTAIKDLKFQYQHTHDPLDDASQNAELFFYTNLYLCNK